MTGPPVGGEAQEAATNEAKQLRAALESALTMWVSPFQYGAMFDGIMASVLPVVEPLLDELGSLRRENEALRNEVGEYRGAITWDTTCFNCASLLDSSYASYCEKEEAVRERDLAQTRLTAALTENEALKELIDRVWEGHPTVMGVCAEHGSRCSTWAALNEDVTNG